MLTSLRLFTRAPCTRIRSWLSAACSAGDCVSVLLALLIVSPSVVRGLVTAPSVQLEPALPDRSAHLVDPDVVAGGITQGTVAHAVRLLGGLLDDLGAAGLQTLEGAVEVGGGQDDAGVGALGHHLGDRAALVVGEAGF